jgi:hypothetical protein
VNEGQILEGTSTFFELDPLVIVGALESTHKDKIIHPDVSEVLKKEFKFEEADISKFRDKFDSINKVIHYSLVPKRA